MKKQDMKDRMDESMGMKMYESKHSKGPMDSQFYGMISEDKSEPANLPQHVVQKTYPKPAHFDSHELDDTIRGLDDTRTEDIKKMERYESVDKY